MKKNKRERYREGLISYIAMSCSGTGVKLVIYITACPRLNEPRSTVYKRVCTKVSFTWSENEEKSYKLNSTNSERCSCNIPALRAC